MNRAVATAERVTRLCVPDLNDQPLYLAQPHADGITRQMLDGRCGLYYPRLDLILRPQLASSGQWRGEGVAVCVDAFACFAMADDDDSGLRTYIGAVLHEIGHWLDWPDVPNRKQAASVTEFESVLADYDQRQQRPNSFSAAFLAHGADFIRVCAHLWYRARHGGGCVLQPRHLAFGNVYSGLEYLDAPEEYIDALGAELKACQYMPLRDVADLEPPAEFTARWNETLFRTFAAESAA